MEQKKTSSKKTILIVIVALGLLVAILYPVWSPYVLGAKNGDSKSVQVQVIDGDKAVILDERFQTEKEKLGDFFEEKNLVKFENSTYGRFITTVKDIKADATHQGWMVTINGKDIEQGVDATDFQDGDKITIELREYQ